MLLNAKTKPAERSFGGVSNRTLKNELQMSVCLTNQREERILLRSAPSHTNLGISCLEDLEVLTSTALYASSRMESWFNWLQPCRIKQNVVSIAGSSFLSVLASDLEVLAAFRPKKGSSSRHTSRIFHWTTPEVSDHPDSSTCPTACRSLKETNDRELYKGFRLGGLEFTRTCPRLRHAKANIL